MICRNWTIKAQQQKKHSEKKREKKKRKKNIIENNKYSKLCKWSKLELLPQKFPK